MSTVLETIAKQLTYRPKERMDYLRSLALPEQSAVFELLSPHVQQALIAKLKTNELVDIIDHMDLRQAEKVLARIKSDKKRERIVSQIRGEAKDKLEYFLRFHPKATMSLVSFNYLYVSDQITVGEAADAIDEHYRDTGRFPEVLVHKQGELVGEVVLSTLVRERNNAKLQKFIQPVTTIAYQADLSEIATVLSDSKRQKVVVLDHDESVLGLIYADDALRLFGHLPAESLYDVAGLDTTERPFDAAALKFKHRYRWLVLNLMTAFLAGSMVYLFENTIDQLVILAMYIPIVAGMGGNAASQAFAVMLRGLTLGTVSWRSALPVLQREALAGFYNGCVIGSIVAVISVLWNHSWTLGLVIGTSMVLVHIIAGLAGTAIPLLAKHYGKDPASISSIVITTITDVGGLFIMLGMATLLLV